MRPFYLNQYIFAIMCTIVHKKVEASLQLFEIWLVPVHV